MRSISIDYGIMEKAKNVFVVKVDYDWNDVGSWDAVYDMMKKDNNRNVSKGDVIYEDSTGNLVYSGGRNISLVGVDDLVIIDTPDALMIVPRGQSERVKELVDNFEKDKKDSLL